MKMNNKFVIVTVVMGLSLAVILMSFNFKTFQSDTDNLKSLPLGSVIYSILPQDVMNIKYPNQFILLSGKPLDESSSLYKLLDEQNRLDILQRQGENVNLLPDGRGVFIRGMNLGQRKEVGDPDGERSLGTYQADMFASHSHGGWVGRDAHGNPDGSTDRRGGAQNPGGNDRYPVVPKSIDASGAIETRPKNITLYTYVKIN